MCQKVIYHYKNTTCRVSYTDLNPKLPILMKNGKTILLPWGGQKYVVSQLPIDNWIPLNEVYAGKWDEYFPKPVKLPLDSFIETLKITLNGFIFLAISGYKG